MRTVLFSAPDSTVDGEFIKLSSIEKLQLAETPNSVESKGNLLMTVDTTFNCLKDFGGMAVTQVCHIKKILQTQGLK